MRLCSMPLCLIVCAAVFAGCQTNPETGRRQLTLLPASQVAAMGEEAKPELIKQYGGEVESPQLRAYIDDIGRRLLPHVAPEFSDIEWDFVVLDSDIINAFALPGGNVFISRGLLQMFDNEAQVAGVLGHEIGHVTGRHVDERISQAVGLQGIVIGVGAAVGASESQLIQMAPDIIGGVGQGFLLKFGRDQESEADRLGVRYMTGAGYDPQGMVQVLQVLRDASGGGAGWEILSTHPNPDRRIREIDNLIDRQYAHTKNNPDYLLYADRFQQRARPHIGPKPQAGSAVIAWCSCCAGSHAALGATMRAE